MPHKITDNTSSFQKHLNLFSHNIVGAYYCIRTVDGFRIYFYSFHSYSSIKSAQFLPINAVQYEVFEWSGAIFILY